MRLPLLAAAASLTLFATASSASAGLNDRYCKPSPAHPNPVVIVHGRGGDVNGFGTLVDTLNRAGYCVYGTNYGRTGGVGANGMDHLWISADQIRSFIEGTLASTGTKKVDVVAHSAGGGVVDNYILKKGGAAKIQRVISFGALHHPYAHAGAAKFADGDLFLPNLIVTARKVKPDVTAQEVIKSALALYAVAGGSLAGVDVETAESNFASDLFDPVYWKDLHGALSEPDGTYIKFGSSTRSIKTRDAAPEVCYTNIVGIADVVTGATAGFQDEAPNVDNFVLPTTSDHSQITADPLALAKMLAGLGKTCAPSTTPPSSDPGTDDVGVSDPSDEPTDAGGSSSTDASGTPSAKGSKSDVDAGTDSAAAGCACATSGRHSSSLSALAAAALAIAILRRRIAR